MLKQEITYEDFNGNSVTETFYFNLSKSEMIELEVSYKEGLSVVFERIVKSEDREQLIAEFKRIILMAYGEKSDDGKRFVKSDELRTNFSQTAAYDTFFMKLATEDDAALKFIDGIMPKDISAKMDKDKPVEKFKALNLPDEGRAENQPV